MKNKILTTLLAVAFVGGFFALYLSGSTKQVALVANQTNQTEQQKVTREKWETKTEEQASVTVVVTPLDLSPQSKEWKFDIGMNTHSVELDQNMTKIVVLLDDQGKEYKPLRWEGAEAGGHHREGVLIFNKITPIPKSLRLKIFDVGGVVRIFAW